MNLDKLSLCKAAYEAGNGAAVALGVQICVSLGRPLPDWLAKAAIDLIFEAIDPSAKKKSGRHSRPLRRLNELRKHLRRYSEVRKRHGEGTPLEEAFTTVANLEGKEPGTIERSYNRAAAILRNEADRAFISPWYDPVIAEINASLVERKGVKPRQKRMKSSKPA